MQSYLCRFSNFILHHFDPDFVFHCMSITPCQPSNCEYVTANIIDVIVAKLITGDKYAVNCCILELESILLLITY